ncbi:unnamed protein product [Rotaria socialis]|uniref:NAD(P)(+)--arginine ADP-ribosyltransferase n=3 Tax=Rotaria socialis TaxID=392032 RepID=A0A817UYZ3_9BILA|nr:unnamed protein product [Rotaria socialis]
MLNDFNSTNANKKSYINPEIQANERCRSKSRIVQNFIIIWLDPDIDEVNVKFPDSIARLRSIQTWTKEWTKVNGIFTQAEQICSLLKDNVKQCDHNTIPISIVSVDDLSKPNLNEVEPLFMYSQILKEILLEMASDEHAEKELVQFWREQYYDNASVLKKIVDEFEQDYHRHTPIWWYTRDCFIYSMINRALRTMNTEVIIKMGFFLLAVHQQIQELHRQQSNTRVPLTVYRGQTISNSEFQKLSNSKGGLLSLNSFMSTSVDPEVANVFCSNLEPNTTGILFKIEIDTSFSSNPFALLTNVSYFFDQEKEILLSTHAIFQIGEMIEIENRLWHVQLILTTGNDKQLEVITEWIRQETSGPSAWHRLGQLMIKLEKLNEAEKIYQILLDSVSQNDEEHLYFLYNQLGYIKHNYGNNDEALQLYQKALEIQEKLLPHNHPLLATT